MLAPALLFPEALEKFRHAVVEGAVRGTGVKADANTCGQASKRWKLLIMQGAECLQLQQERAF